jgi:hypothetical protein
VKLLVLLLFLTASSFAIGADEPAPPEARSTPPRLSFIDGQASFRRAGADDWTPARVNMPLAPGDALYTADRSNLEIQVAARAFVRAGTNSQIGLVNIEPDFLQFELKSGTASLDLRSVPPSYSFELDTPNAVFTIENPGYYRAEIDGDTTHFITRRGGRATISVEGSPSQTISPSEEIVVRGTTEPTVATYVAPQLDAWDRWNYTRTEHEIEALSARYVSPGVYGLGDLDQYGVWRVVPDYGAVWVPDGVVAGWAPYTIGSWIWDPYYEWTWVDVAPWGWAPFHYGRWVFINQYWAWAPGPVIARPIYAPALVAFFGVAPGLSVRIGIGGPVVSWVALGWGEPLRPWWGRPGFIGVPWWGGWGGPHLVNNVVIEPGRVVDVNAIVYQNTRVPNGIIAASEKQFGAGQIRGARFTAPEPRELEPIRETLPVRPGPASVAPVAGKAIRPPAQVASRSVVETRPPREITLPWKPETPAGKPPPAAPAPRVVTPPKRPETTAALPRPSFGQNGPERPRPERAPRYEELQRAPVPSPAPPAAGAIRQRAAPPAAALQRQARPAQGARVLPGRPANTLFPRRMGRAAAVPRRAASTVRHR